MFLANVEFIFGCAKKLRTFTGIFVISKEIKTIDKINCSCFELGLAYKTGYCRATSQEVRILDAVG